MDNFFGRLERLEFIRSLALSRTRRSEQPRFEAMLEQLGRFQPATSPCLPQLGLSEKSIVSDRTALEFISFIDYMGKDVRAAWYGGGIPKSELSEFEPLANWALEHWAMYYAFIHGQDGRGYGLVDGDVLDIGCGAGNMTHNLATVLSSRNVVGVDLDMNLMRFASTFCSHPRVEYRAQNAFDVSNQRKFAAVFAIEILEHLPAHRHHEFVESCLGLLKSGGLLFLTTPNAVDEHDTAFGHIGMLNAERVGPFFRTFSRNLVYAGFMNNQILRTDGPGEYFVHSRWEDHQVGRECKSHFALVMSP
jgi:2-polyprenyl-3-methyl-5-hydroxy-6-metoxy-1,4-benzoquinol methylase